MRIARGLRLHDRDLTFLELAIIGKSKESSSVRRILPCSKFHEFKSMDWKGKKRNGEKGIAFYLPLTLRNNFNRRKCQQIIKYIKIEDQVTVYLFIRDHIDEKNSIYCVNKIHQIDIIVFTVLMN